MANNQRRYPRYDWDYENSPYSRAGSWNAPYPEDLNTPGWTYEEDWWTTGPYTGVGPQGYNRSDERICEEVCRRLAGNGRLDASNIEVDVNNHEVILNGTVDSRDSKRLAEDLADSVFGVDDVRNNLHVSRSRPDTSHQPGQSSSTGQVLNAFPLNIHTGEQVIGKMGHIIGRVKEVHNQDFVLNRPLVPDVHVPFTAIQDAKGNQVRLNVTTEQIDKQGWKHLA